MRDNIPVARLKALEDIAKDLELTKSNYRTLSNISGSLSMPQQRVILNIEVYDSHDYQGGV